MLPPDVARCIGVGSAAEGWREGCEDCARRLDVFKDDGSILTWMEPPAVIAFWCEFHLAQYDKIVTNHAPSKDDFWEEDGYGTSMSDLAVI